MVDLQRRQWLRSALALVSVGAVPASFLLGCAADGDSPAAASAGAAPPDPGSTRAEDMQGDVGPPDGVDAQGGLLGGDDAGAGDDPESVPGEPALPVVNDQGGLQFLHGVASGDPLADRVVLWTRVSPQSLGPIQVDYQVALDPELTQLVATGRSQTDGERDYTVKVDVAELSAATTYYYRFHDPARPELQSDLGRTRTLPVGDVDRVRLAFVSCSSYAHGYFNSYAHVAARRDLDAVVHLGDYIYEYGAGEYGDPELDRTHRPPREIVTLEDYRVRHGQYKEDPDLREAHRQHPFIAVWDDHEFADNAYRDGASNHAEDGSEGDWLARRTAAARAYREWMPIRDPGPDNDPLIYRSFRFGQLADLVMLDTRITGRDDQARGDATDPGRSLLGPTQESWLFEQLSSSSQDGVGWRILGQQVVMSQWKVAGVLLNEDSWDGYAATRERLFDHLEAESIDNLVVMTGDVHSSWACDVARDPFGDGYDADTGTGSLATEMVVTSVTSPMVDGALSSAANGLFGLALPHVHWVDTEHRGYVLLDVTPERVQGEWYHAETIKEPLYTHRLARAYAAFAGQVGLRERFEPTEERVGGPDLA